MKKVIILLFVVSLYWSCKQTSNRYEIMDFKYNPKNNVAAYSVYTPDTNWVEMKKFAKELLKDKDKHSAIAFCNPKEKAVKFKKNWGMLNAGYIVAIYGYDEETNQSFLIKESNRFKPEMHFEK